MKKTIALTIALSMMLAACGGGNSQTPDNVNPPAAQTESSANAGVNPAWKTYVVGSQLTYPPFHYQGEKGEPLGFEMELLQAVAKAGEFNVSIQHTPRSALEQTLNDGTVQIWSSTVSMSPERMAKMDFSEPFMNRDYEVIYILDNDANKGIIDLSGFQNKKIAVNNYSPTPRERAIKLTGSANNVEVTDSYHLSMKALFAGDVDGAMDNGLVLANYLKNNKDLPKTRSITVSDEAKKFGFAVKKGNTEILDKLNKGLEKVKADGTYQALVEKWFGNEEI